MLLTLCVLLSFCVWRYDATDMSLYRSALSACVVRGLPNVQDFIYKPPVKEERSTSTTITAAAAAAATATES